MAFNKELFRAILCNMSFIANENVKTFIQLFEYLKNKYNFEPPKVSIDFSKAEYIALNNAFKNIYILPCFFILLAI